ncbi:MAG: DUF4864 domain-containing protein [Pseudomonadota bacterium]
MRLIAILTGLMLLLAPWTVQSAEPDDSIQAVIADQIAAFQKNDVERAFTHASPNIQRMFGDPKRFGQMVEQGYPMVWRPARYEWLKVVQTDFGPVQVVLFEDQSGRLHEAGYLMQQVDGVWRINGVKLREVEGVGT